MHLMCATAMDKSTWPVRSAMDCRTQRLSTAHCRLHQRRYIHARTQPCLSWSKIRVHGNFCLDGLHCVHSIWARIFAKSTHSTVRFHLPKCTLCKAPHSYVFRYGSFGIGVTNFSTRDILLLILSVQCTFNHIPHSHVIVQQIHCFHDVTLVSLQCSRSLPSLMCKHGATSFLLQACSAVVFIDSHR